jgi:hypothetical protein
LATRARAMPASHVSCFFRLIMRQGQNREFDPPHGLGHDNSFVALSDGVQRIL